ncbi:MAG: hypothetical protein HYY02_01625 [Chloroflexi bacterium]|nr:hypothetical protein [Chloroflexota bacterium]
MQRAIESAGIPTVSLSIFRGHSEQLKLPRVLLTRFARGSTVGPPGEPQAQRRVLLQALRLLETASAPTLQEFVGD